MTVAAKRSRRLSASELPCLVIFWFSVWEMLLLCLFFGCVLAGSFIYSRFHIELQNHFNPNPGNTGLFLESSVKSLLPALTPWEGLFIFCVDILYLVLGLLLTGNSVGFFNTFCFLIEVLTVKKKKLKTNGLRKKEKSAIEFLILMIYFSSYM